MITSSLTAIITQDRFADIFPELQGQCALPSRSRPTDRIFQNGTGFNTSLLGNARVGDGTNVGFSVGYQSETGFVEQNTLDRLNLTLTGNTKFSEKLSLQSTYYLY